MPAAVAAVAGFVGAAASAVGAAAGAIAATVGGVIASVAASVTSVVSSVVGTITGAVAAVGSVIGSTAQAIYAGLAKGITGIATTVGSVVERTGSVIAGTLEVIGSLIGQFAHTIHGGITEGITAIARAIGTATKPILQPIADTLTAIDKSLTGIETWVKTTLKPVVELYEQVDRIAGYFSIYKLLTQTKDVTALLEAVGREAGLETATAIAQLMRNIVETTTDTMEWTRNVFTAFDQRVIHVADRVREANELGLAELRAQLEQQILPIRADLDFNVTRFDRDLVRIERRVEDFPWFVGMLMKALK